MHDDTRRRARVELDIGPECSTLLLVGVGGELSCTLIAIGQANVHPGLFAGESISALALEAAIEIIEERPMPRVRALPGPAGRSTTAPAVDLGAAIAAAPGRAPAVPLRVDEVEVAFPHLASLASGMPECGDDPLQHAGTATALRVRREWTHPAGLDEVRLG